MINSDQIPARVHRIMKSIRFKSAASAMRHLRHLMANWYYSTRNADIVNYQRQTARAKEHRAARIRAAHHTQVCQQAYQAKLTLCRRGIGNHSTEGIPDHAMISVS